MMALKLNIILTGLILLSLVFGSNCASLYTTGYVGCFVHSIGNIEFASFASHLDQTTLTPASCSKACFAVNYQLAAILDGTMCFCKSVSTVVSTATSNSSCQVSSCAGDATLFCGAVGYYLVYQALSGTSSIPLNITSVSITDMSNAVPSAVTLFSRVNMGMNFVGQATYGYLIENRELTRTDSLSSLSNITYQQPVTSTAPEFFEFVVSTGSDTASTASRKATSFSRIDPIGGLAMSCPSTILNTDYLRCNITFTNGTNLKASIDYGDGQSPDVFTVGNYHVISYGLPVPKSIYNLATMITSTTYYVALNAEIKSTGYLVGLEIYAQSSGTVTFMMIGSTTTGYSLRNQDYTSVLNTQSSTFNCAGSNYSHEYENCLSVNKLGRFSSLSSLNSVVGVSVSLSLTAGYNLFTQSTLGAINVYPGYIPYFGGSINSIAVDTSGIAPFNDFLYSSSNGFTVISPLRFYVRTIVSPSLKAISAFRLYSTPGTYTVTATVSNILLPYSNVVTSTVTVTLAPIPITGLQFATSYGLAVCYMNTPCIFQSTVATGNNINYEWNVDGNITTTNLTSITSTFTSVGTYVITLVASNSISTANYTLSISVANQMYGLSFKAGTMPYSSSIVGQSADFLFIILAGANYNCAVKFGDGSSTTVTDAVYYVNNTYVSHTYSSEAVYTVSVNCTNPLNSLNLTFNHYVQYPLVGLALTNTGALLNTAYTVGYSLQSGSTPYNVSFYFDGVLDSGAQYSNLVGKSSNHAGESTPTIHYIYINMTNYVSNIQLNATFQISSPLQNVQFTVTPTSGISSYTYQYPVYLNLTTTMTSGSNVLMVINTDSLNQASTLPNNTISVQTTGSWTGPYVNNYSYAYPGGYTISANISNSLVSYIFTQAVKIISLVDYLIPNLSTNSNKVVFQSFDGGATGTAQAQFVFNYMGSTMAGSDAYVTFWPGDSTNSSQGPYALNMDFAGNVSRSSLQYTYNALGTYTVVFYVSNPLGAKSFTFTLTVVYSLLGFYIDVNPSYTKVGSSVNVNAYLIQGNNVNYVWYSNGAQLAAAPKASTTYSVPDSQPFTPSAAANYTLSVSATDTVNSVTLTKTYVLQVQAAILSMTASVSPTGPQTNIDSNPSSRTFVFTINLTPSNPTNVFYVIDFGDGSPIKMPTYMSSSSAQTSYTYAGSGIYSVNVTAFNKVSTFSQILSVQLYSDFSGFTCAPYWRQFPSDTCTDYPYSITNGTYYVKSEYDIRFFCTWIRTDAVPTQFTMYLNGNPVQTITNITALTKLSTSTTVGYILPYLSSNIGSGGDITIQVNNPSFTQSYLANVAPYSSLSNVQWVSIDSAIQAGTSQTLQLTYQSLGEPSCVITTYTTTANVTTQLGLFGTSNTTCYKYFPTLMANYIGDYSVYASPSTNTLSFTTTKLTRLGNNLLKAYIINAQASITTTTNYTAVAQLGLCEIPKVDILNRTQYFYQPITYSRSDTIVLSGLTTLNCSSGLANTKQWYVYALNKATGNQVSQVSLSSNPTSNYAELVIQPNTLGYSVYKAVYQVTMSYNSIYTDQVETYFEIAPAGLVISSMYGAPGGGTFETNRGIGQTIILSPVPFSYDIDGVANIATQSFKFYCQVIDNNVPYGYPQLYYGQNIDLLTVKTNYSTNPGIPTLMQSTTTPFCFSSTSGFYFSSPNNLTIMPGALAYVQNRKYQFLVQTTYLGNDYAQNVIIDIQNVNYVPLLTLGCKFAAACNPYAGYVKINPNTELFLVGSCYSGCDYLTSIQYQYNTYQSWSLSATSSQTIWYYYPNTTAILGTKTTELDAQSSVFLDNPNIFLWKFEFTLTATTPINGIATGVSSMIVLVNQLPYGGTCNVSPLTGIALNTTFTVTCSNWQDKDGVIANYAFYANVQGQQTGLGFGTSLTGVLSTQNLPIGPSTDSYRLYLYVNIIDNDNGVTTYNISTPIQVQPDTSTISNLIQELSNPSSTGTISNILASGNSQVATTVLLSVSSLLNSASSSSNASSNDTTLSNQNSALRDYLATYINNLSISDINSVSNQASMLTALTAASNEVTRNTADAVTNQCIRLIESLSSMSGSVSTDQLQFAAIGITNALGNVISGLSGYLNGQQDSSLSLDYTRAITPPEYYDTDVENYWSNPNNFFGDYGTDASVQQVNTMKNVAQQQFLNVNVAQKMTTITDLIADLVAQRFAVGQSFSISSSSINMQLQKIVASNLTNEIKLQYAKIELPSYCELMINSEVVTTTTTKSPYIDPIAEANNCTNQVITLKSVLLPLSISGFNSRNETYTGSSLGLELSFLDQNGDVIPVQNLLTPIEVWVPRSTSASEDIYQYVNTSNVTISNDFQLMPNSVNISSTNASLHIQIRPKNFNLAYLVLVRFGSTPILNRTSAIYDYWTIVCPGDIQSYFDNITGSNDTFYLVFLNMAKVNGFKGFVGYGIRELLSSEQTTYCSSGSFNTSSLQSPPFLPSTLNQTRFTADFSIKTYTSGCYYYNTNTGKWNNKGMEIYSDTNIFTSHCKTTHLTQFAGGLVVVPSQIDFAYFVQNASPGKNPTIYAVVLTLACIYVIFLAWALLFDVKDSKRLAVNILPDNMFGDVYSYEIIVFTGSRKDAATDSKVKMILNGDLDETNERLLENKTRPVFRHGGVDSFLMTVSRPLGQLNYLRIWHDNSGESSMASWYLKFIIVHDLQTRERFYFPCFNWLAVERSDGKINRTLGVAGRKQVADIALYAEKNMNDGHLWLSIFSKPLYSTLTRVDRVACCFLILYVFMLASILYYGVDPTPTISGFQIGPFCFTTVQIAIAFAINVIVLLPCFLLIFLLKRSKVRLTKSRKLKDALDINMEITNFHGFSSIDNFDEKHPADHPDHITDEKGRRESLYHDNHTGHKWRKKFLLPWWTRIIVHILCNIAIIAAAFFIIVKGVDFGDQLVQKWLASLIVSFFMSIILCQPLQVIAVAFLCGLLFRKRRRLAELDIDNDHEDNGKNLNKYWRFHDIEYKLNPFKSAYTEAFHLNEHQLQEAREMRMREIRIWQAIREIIVYLIFMTILFYINYTNIGASAFDYNNMLKQTFAITELESINDFWDWAQNTLAVGLRANTWYNGRQPYGLAGYTNDFVSRMIGYGLMRQVRVSNNSCSVPNQMTPYVDFCESSYTVFNSEANSFGYGWTPYNSSFTPAHGMEQIYRAFQYQDSDQLSGYPYTGEYTTYSGDGFVYEMRGSLKFIQGNLSLLQQMGWVDRQTRAVFFQFTLYNPNINMLSVATILIEFLPTGTILVLPRFDPLNLFNEVNSSSGTNLKIAIYLVYFAIITYFMICELIEMYKVGIRSYFRRFWNYIEWMLILSSYLAFALFFYRLSVAYEVLDFFKRTSGYGYMNLQGINTWNQVLTISLALCCVFGTLRLLKLFRFYKKMYTLALTLKHCIKELLGFGVMFTFVWVAFVQMLYLYFYDKLESYWNPLNAFTTSFECLVGKFDKNLKLSENYLLGPIIFVIYPIVMAFMMINIFITIVCESFKEVRYEINREGDDLRFFAYFNDKIKERFSDPNSRARINNDRYLEPTNKLPRNVDRLIDNLSKAYEENICIENMLNHSKAIDRR